MPHRKDATAESFENKYLKHNNIGHTILYYTSNTISLNLPFFSTSSSMESEEEVEEPSAASVGFRPLTKQISFISTGKIY